MNRQFGIIAMTLSVLANNNPGIYGMKILILSVLLVATSYAFSSESDVVQVASLTVKERIQSIEEINVTAKNPTINKPANTPRVENILAEARLLEKEPSGDHSTRK